MNSLIAPLVLWFVFVMLLQLSHGQTIAPSSETAPGASSNGETIDQGIAYVLMLIALVLTYIFH